MPLKQNAAGEWEVRDDKRIKDSLATIELLQKSGARQIVLMSHLGRPEGKAVDKLSLDPIAKYLSQLLGQEVPLIKDYDQPGFKLNNSTQVVLLENLRFSELEKKNDLGFAQKLAKLGDIYINDAFSASHRAHASVSKISELLPSYAGLALTKEVEMLSSLMENPQRPFVVVVGGAKISDKVSAIENLAQLADIVLVGGGVANNFLKADGFAVFKSYLEDSPADLSKKGQNFVEFAKNLLQTHQQEHTLLNDYLPLPKIIYPVDVMTGDSLDDQTPIYHQLLNLEPTTQEAQKLKKEMFLDIGPKTIKLFKAVIKNAGTIFWNGPMGVFENDHFSQGTQEIAQSIASSKARSILGGGDTIAAIDKWHLENKFDYVSAAGGASLEFLSGKELPGLKNLIK